MSFKTDWKLLARFLSQESSESEKQRISAWLEADPERQDWMNRLHRLWMSTEKKSPGSDIDALWRDTARKAGILGFGEPERESVQPQPAPKRSRAGGLQAGLRGWAFAAGCLALLVSIFVLVRVLTGPSGSGDLLVFAVPYGEQSRFSLADGTMVSLDSGTVLRYPGTFQGEFREVYLDGEAYFEVEHDSGRPFILHAGRAVIRVLGTEFNVRAWDEEGRVEVEVSRGRVSVGVESGPDSEEVVLEAGQWSVLTEQADLLSPQDRSGGAVAAWRRREASFQDIPLEDILFQLERWYDLKFVSTQGAVSPDRLTVHIENQTVDDILDLLSTLTDLRFEREDNKVFLRPKN